MDLPTDYPSNADTPRLIGQLTTVPVGLKAAKNEAGFLRYGPYIRLPMGRYSASFKLLAQGDGVQEFGRVDVIANARVIAEDRIVRPGEQIATLYFELNERTDNIEFRVFSSGAGELTIYNVQLAYKDEE